MAGRRRLFPVYGELKMLYNVEDASAVACRPVTPPVHTDPVNCGSLTGSITMQTRMIRSVISTLLLGFILVISGIVSTGSIAAKRTFEPHQFTILFTGDDWAGYKGSCG